LSVLLQCFFDTFPLAKNVQRFLHEMPSRFCSFYFVNVHTHIVVCVCVSIGNAHDIFQPLLAGTQRRTDDVPSLSRMCWLFCDLHFLLYFPLRLLRQNRRRRRKRAVNATFRGLRSGGAAGFSHTRVKFTQLLVTPPKREKERERERKKKYV
jgi:hypothetical protein